MDADDVYVTPGVSSTADTQAERIRQWWDVRRKRAKQRLQEITRLQRGLAAERQTLERQLVEEMP